MNDSWSAVIEKDFKVTLPKAVVEALDLHPGDKIDWIIEGDIVAIKKVK